MFNNLSDGSGIEVTFEVIGLLVTLELIWERIFSP